LFFKYHFHDFALKIQTLFFEKNNKNIRIKTVINNEEAISNLSTCKKIEIFEKES